MKIQVPVVRLVEVGVARHYGVDRIYHAADRPNVIPPLKIVPIKEPRVELKTILNKDLRIAARAAAAGRLVALTAAYAIALPLAVLHLVGAKIGEGIDAAIDALGDGLAKIGAPTEDIRSNYAVLLKDILQ